MVGVVGEGWVVGDGCGATSKNETKDISSATVASQDLNPFLLAQFVHKTI